MHTSTTGTSSAAGTSNVRPIIGEKARPHVRPSRGTARPSRRVREAMHVFDVAEASFVALTRGPSPLTVDGAALGHGLPARLIDLAELRVILLHPATTYKTGDQVWRHLVTRARRYGSSWVMACVGLALPGLKSAVRNHLVHLDTDPGTGTDRVAGDLLAAFFHALQHIDLDRPKIAQRLMSRSIKAVVRAYRPKVRAVVTDPHTLAALSPAADSSGGHPDQVLEAAIRQGVITTEEAAIIEVTRLEKVSPALLAEHMGTSYEALIKRRRRAEMRLVEAMRDEGLRDDFEYLMSTNEV